MRSDRRTCGRTKEEQHTSAHSDVVRGTKPESITTVVVSNKRKLGYLYNSERQSTGIMVATSTTTSPTSSSVSLSHDVMTCHSFGSRDDNSGSSSNSSNSSTSSIKSCDKSSFDSQRQVLKIPSNIAWKWIAMRDSDGIEVVDDKETVTGSTTTEESATSHDTTTPGSLLQTACLIAVPTQEACRNEALMDDACGRVRRNVARHYWGWKEWLAPLCGTQPKIQLANSIRGAARLESTLATTSAASEYMLHKQHHDYLQVQEAAARTKQSHDRDKRSSSNNSSSSVPTSERSCRIMPRPQQRNRDPEGSKSRSNSLEDSSSLDGTNANADAEGNMDATCNKHTGSSKKNDNDSDSDFEDDNEAEQQVEEGDDDENEALMRAEATLWKTAVDPKSGRTYYYNIKSRETQWRKPMCCATASERRAAAKKEQQTRDFFASMEANILKSMAVSPAASTATVEVSPAENNAAETDVNVAMDDSNNSNARKARAQSMYEVDQALPRAPHQRPSLLVRTISSMEASVLADLIQRVPSYRSPVDDDDDDSNVDDEEDEIGFRPVVGDSSSSSLRMFTHAAPSTTNLLLSPIQETAGASPSMAGTAATDESSCMSPASDSTPHQGVEREVSLNFGSLFARQQSATTTSGVVGGDTSFHLSAMMRDHENSTSSRSNFMNSTNASSRFNLGGTGHSMASVIPEGDNEDESILSSNYFNNYDSGSLSTSNNQMSFSRDASTGNNGSMSSLSLRRLTRDVGKLQLVTGDSNDAAAAAAAAPREGLARMHGSLQLNESFNATTAKPSRGAAVVPGRQPVSREESLDLSFLTQTKATSPSKKESNASSWSFAKDVSSLALDPSGWGSFWSQSDEYKGTMTGAAGAGGGAGGRSFAREGASMRELVAITQEMANVELSSESSSSNNSLDGLSALPSDDTIENRHSSSIRTATNGNPSLQHRQHGSRNFSADSLDYSDDAFDVDASPSILPTKKTTTTTPLLPIRRPVISRPMSLRSDVVKATPTISGTVKLPGGRTADGSANEKNGPSTMMEKPGMLRRNTCGTLYVGSTMSAPDKDATIKCVCAVYRAHILQAELDERSSASPTTDDAFRVFADVESRRLNTDSSVSSIPHHPSPSLEDITLFYRDVFGRAQMESDCIIMTLIYVERLIKVTEGALRPRSTNWRSILFSCMVLSSKVWDDLSMWNADFSQTCPAGVKFSLKRVNELEIAVLSALQYKVKVPASEYAKYYFLLRSMLIKSGLGSEDLQTMNPLDVEGAKQLQHVSAQYQVSVASLSEQRSGRSKSTGTTSSTTTTPAIAATNDKVSPEGNRKPDSLAGSGKQRGKVGLEHVVHM